jgi:hypothetical protein
MIGETRGPYRVLEKLGAGGMDAPAGGTGRATYFAVTELLAGETLSSRH